MRIRVDGGRPLSGTYRPSGNTNAAVALLGASLMTDQPMRLTNVPRAANVQVMIDLAQWLGASTQNGGDQLLLHTPQVTQRQLTPMETQGYAGALLYIAPILARRGYVRLEIDFPLNRVRTHLEALRDLGQDVVIANGAIEIRRATWDYRDILMTQPSVTATGVALLLAATLGEETVIANAASEPHIQDLANALEMMGAQIEGIGSNTLRVFGKRDLHGIEFAIGPNHIEAASVAAMIALSGGRGQVDGTRQRDMRMIERIFKRLGLMLDVDTESIFIPRHTDLAVSNREEDVDASIETAPWPGFPSDLVAIATVAATQARGTSLIHEKLFNNRLLFIDKLNAMAAQIMLCDPHRAIVVGRTELLPIYMDTPDVRAGLGLLGAALIADGETVIDNAQAITRSFDGVLDKLTALGAGITVD